MQLCTLPLKFVELNNQLAQAVNHARQEYGLTFMLTLTHPIKVERHQGRNGDNSALNAVKLYCGAHGNTYIGSSDGPWGDWQGNNTNYPAGG